MSDPSFSKKSDISSVTRGGFFGYISGIAGYFKKVGLDLKKISWVPDEGMRHFLVIVLVSIFSLSLIVYCIDLLTGLFIRGVSVIIGAFF